MLASARENHRIAAVATIQDVIARSAREGIISDPSLQGVVAVCADELVVEAVADAGESLRSA